MQRLILQIQLFRKGKQKGKTTGDLNYPVTTFQKEMNTFKAKKIPLHTHYVDA